MANLMISIESGTNARDCFAVFTSRQHDDFLADMHQRSQGYGKPHLTSTVQLSSHMDWFTKTFIGVTVALSKFQTPSFA